jgi:hypothetical protein
LNPLSPPIGGKQVPDGSSELNTARRDAMRALVSTAKRDDRGSERET